MNELVQRVIGYLNRFGIMVTTGVVVLFFGVAFLLKYAADSGLLPVELRLAAAAIAGIALVAIGWRTRSSRPLFARSLQGGGIGILYLTVFAALRLYELIPSGFAFFLLAAFVALTATLALLQDSQSLAALATAGGFLAPVLTSTGAGSYVAESPSRSEEKASQRPSGDQVGVSLLPAVVKREWTPRSSS